MSLKTIKQVKDNKIFRLWDIVIYVLLVTAIVAMFIVMFQKNKSAGDITGVEISYKNTVVGSFSFEDNSFTDKGGTEVSFEVSEEEGIVNIVIYMAEGNGYNILVIDCEQRRASMKDANCSSDKDCTYMSIKKPIDSIICIPHDLVITATTNSFSLPGDIIV